MKRWQQISLELRSLEAQRHMLNEEFMRIQWNCRHPKLPPRFDVEQYMDLCPDCGYVAYCYGV